MRLTGCNHGPTYFLLHNNDLFPLIRFVPSCYAVLQASCIDYPTECVTNDRVVLSAGLGDE